MTMIKLSRLLFLFIFFVLLTAAPTLAADITIPATTMLNWQRPAPQVWIFYSTSFTASDGTIIPAGNAQNKVAYLKVTCTLVGTTLTIPQHVIKSTRDGLDNTNSRVTYVMFTTSGAEIVPNPLAPYSNMAIPATITSSTGCAPTTLCGSLAELKILQGNLPPPPPPMYYDTTYIDRIVAASITGAPAGATYIVRTPNAALTNAFALDSLGTGPLKSTAGVLTIAVAGTDYQAPITTTAPITFIGNVVAIPLATSAVDGYLSAADRALFFSKQAALGFTPENAANKNATNGYAGLASGKVANSQLSEVLAPADLTGVTGVQGTGTTLPIGTFAGITNGQTLIWDAGTSNFIPGISGSGTVTSVALTVPAWLNITGSPITTSGTLAVTAATGQAANGVLAAPDGTSGALSVRTLVAGDLPTVTVAKGGTGLTSLTTYSLIAGGTTSTGNVQQVGLGTSGQVLTSGGAGVLPTFQTLPAAAAHDFLGSSHNNTTSSPIPTRGSIITAQNPGTASWAERLKGTQYQVVQATATDTVFDAVHLDQAAAITGTLPVANGGTGAATLPLNGVLFGNGTGAIQSVVGGALTLCLQATDGGAPFFGSCAGSAATAWSSLTSPAGTLALAMGTNPTTFTWSAGMASSGLTLQDTVGSTSTNHVLLVQSRNSSTMKPFAALAQEANGVEMSNLGALTAIGTGTITATNLAGVGGNGAIGQTTTGNFEARTFTDGVGVTWTNGDLTTGNPSAAWNPATYTANVSLWPGTDATRTLTANLSGTDPVITFGSSVVNISTGTLQQGGTPVVLESRTFTGGTGISGTGLGDLSANRTINIDLTFAPTWTGVHTFTPGARASGVAPYLTINAPTDTSLTADTEAIGILFNSATRGHADGTTQTNQREYVFEAPTYSAAGTSIITNAATLAIEAAPIAGSNMTLTNKYALWIQGGQTQLDGRVVFGTTPVYDLGSNLLAVDTLSSHTSVTVPASSFFYHERLSTITGDYNSFTVSTGATVAGYGSFIESLSGSHATSNAYAAVFQVSNEGPGTAKAVHTLAEGVAGSTGVLTAATFDVIPVTGQGETFPVQIATSGITNVSTGILFSTNNATNFKYGIDFYGVNTHPAYNLGAIRLPYNNWIVSKNSAASADRSMFRLATVDSVADTIEAAAALNITASNAYFKLSTGANAWTFQVIDSTSAFRILRSGVGDALGISAAGITNLWKGANVASAAAITPTGNIFHVTGTTTITSITSTNIVAGTTITIIFDGILTFTDGSNLKLAGNFVTTADDSITLVYDGTNWYEVARAVN